jgi:hypothetical protein
MTYFEHLVFLGAFGQQATTPPEVRETFDRFVEALRYLDALERMYGVENRPVEAHNLRFDRMLPTAARETGPPASTLAVLNAAGASVRD